MQKTLMEKFIDERLRQYRDMGRGRKRRVAALYNAVTNKSQEEIANLAQTTQNALAVWRTRNIFKANINENVREFLEVLKPHVLAAVEKAHSGIAPTGNDFPEFADSNTYSSKIFTALYQWAMEQPDIRVTPCVRVLLGSRKIVIQYLNEIMPEKIDEGISIMDKPKISTSDKQRIKELLTLVSEYIKIVGGT